MKSIKFIAAAFAVVIAASSCASNGVKGGVDGNDSTAVAVKPVDPKAFLPKKSEIDSVSYLVGINFGSFLKGYNFGDLNYSAIEKGIKDFLNAKGDFRDSTFAEQFKINPELMNEVFNTYLAKRRDYTSAINSKKSADFLAENLKKEGVQATESGLQYTIIEAGNDVKPAATDTVWVKYTGTLIDGTKFDENQAADGTRMLLNRVIKGWTEGLQLIGEGGKIKLYIPADLAYGENGSRGIEPNSALIFDVDLVKVGKFAVEEEAE